VSPTTGAPYLSDEWFAAADRALAASEPLRSAAAGVRLTVQHHVTGGPDGDRCFHVVIDHGAVGLRPGPTESPDVTFTETYDTATAIARGERSAQSAFLTGDLQVGGDLEVLVAHEKPLHAVVDVLADVRAATGF
jgi:hypothetical protein